MKNVLINELGPAQSDSTAMQSSLRSKTTVSKGPRPAAKLNKPNKNARKSKVDDKIKRRMSARYASISSPTPTDTTPSVPTIPLDLRSAGLATVREKDESSQIETPTKEDLRAAENRLLDVEDFDPDTCTSPSILSFSLSCPDLSLRPQAETRQFNGG